MKTVFEIEKYLKDSIGLLLMELIDWMIVALITRHRFQWIIKSKLEYSCYSLNFTLNIKIVLNDEKLKSVSECLKSGRSSNSTRLHCWLCVLLEGGGPEKATLQQVFFSLSDFQGLVGNLFLVFVLYRTSRPNFRVSRGPRREDGETAATSSR